MNIAEVEIAIIGSIQAVMTAIIGGLFARDSKKKKKMLDDAEAQASLRAEESRLSMRLISADVSLSMATARAVKDGTTNGKMGAALVNAEEAQKEYHDFINAVAAKQITQ